MVGRIFVMEYVDGCDLQWLSDRASLDTESAPSPFARMVVIVAAAHQNGIVHRDLKAQMCRFDRRRLLSDLPLSRL